MLRRLNQDDLAAFMQLRRECFQKAPLSFEQEGDIILQPTVVLEQLQETEDKFILGYFDEDGRLSGMMGFYRYLPKKRRHRSYLWGVYLSEHTRGKGIAKKMLQQVIEDAKKMEGLERIILTVSNWAESAIKLYKNEGFVEFGREPGAARTGDTPMDEIYMMLEL